MAHAGPLVGLVVVADGLFAVEAAEDDAEEVVVEVGKDVGGKEAAAEAYHAAQRTEVDVPTGPPLAEGPAAQSEHGAEGEVLHDDGPVGETLPGEDDAREPRGEEGTDGEKGGFAHLHVAEEPGAGGGVERGDDEAEEGDAGQGHEQGLAEPRGYQGGGGKEEEVDSGAA